MSIIKLILLSFLSTTYLFGQSLPPKQSYPMDIKQIHSGHSLTDPLFGQPWPGQYVNLIGIENLQSGGGLFDSMVGKSTVPGSTLMYRWNNPIGYGSPDARLNIGNWELLCITERVPLNYEGGNAQQWYLDGILEQKQYLSGFVNNAWNNGNNGNGAPTLLWTTWTNIDNSNGPWRAMLDIQGAEFERMQDYANLNKPEMAPHVYIIPGHKMMAKLYDDIQLNIVPDITNISAFFSDNIHTNSLGDYAITMMHYACVFNKSPVGLTNELITNPPLGFQSPSPELALYLQNMVWDVVINYPRTGITNQSLSNNNDLLKNEIHIYPNPVIDYINIKNDKTLDGNIKIIVNSMGQVVFKGDENKINMSNFPAGLYFLKHGNNSLKFIKY